MAIFSRRNIQAALNSLTSSLTKQQLEVLVGKLNEPSEMLATEWEVVVLSAFSNCGRIQYEKDFGGKRRPDLFFQFGKSGKFEFLAYITTVSDVNAHEENPYDEFQEVIRRFLQRRGHISAGLHLDVEHEEIGEYGNRKIHLMLPKKGQMTQFVKIEMGQFLTNLAKEPDKDAAFSYDRNGIRFTVQYNSREKRLSGGSHLAYTVPYSKHRNPLANILNDKGNQLSESGYSGAAGVIVCDGGCDALNERSGVNADYGCQAIIESVFRKRSTILFVLVLRIEQRQHILPQNSSIQIMPKLYWNPTRAKTLLKEALVAIKRMFHWLPHPEATPANAIHWLRGRDKNVGRPLGGYSMQGNSIKISARALTELLAGKVELNRFLEEHGFKPSESNRHPCPFFERQLQLGHTLQNTFIESAQDKDDDWIVFEYDGPDAAIAPFRIPQ